MYGAESRVVLEVLKKQAQALRALGRSDEAAKVEQRVESIRSAAGAAAASGPGGPPLIPNH